MRSRAWSAASWASSWWRVRTTPTSTTRTMPRRRTPATEPMRQGASRSAGRPTLGRAACALIAGLLMALPALDAHACSTCGCTLNTDLGNQGVEGGKGWRLDFRYDLVDQTQLRRGGSALSL